MKLQLKPQISSVTERAESASTHSGVTKDGKVRWVYEDAFLEIISTHTNETLASWRFGKVLQDSQTSITAVTEVNTTGGRLLLVATSNVSDCGTINIFSVKTRKVIRAIEVPQRISALEMIFSNETEDISPWIISKHLQFFSGLLAVGTEGGYIYLVDLRLNELNLRPSSELEPKKLMVISPRMVDPLGKKEEAQTYDKHLALLLDEQCHSQEQFYYRRQDDSVQKVFEEDTVWVSSLAYMAQAGTLAVGFSFGCFQLWRLYNPVLDYSSRYNPDSQAVTRFSAQEPENDPRNFVYLWVVHDNAQISAPGIASISLYQLSYTKKDAYANFGIFYDELESVCPRLEHRLTSDPYSSDPRGTSRSSVISCFTVANPMYTPPSNLSDSFEEGFYGNDLSLSVFVWRAESSGQSGVSHWLSVFDMNRWYQAQMPHMLRTQGQSSLQVCSYWAVYSLAGVTAALPSQLLLNVEMTGDKVVRFPNNAPVPPDEHSYPSALQISNVQFVLSSGCVTGQLIGWQRELLRELAMVGSQHLVQPADLFQRCLRARLVHHTYDGSKTNTTDYQRKALLNLALERGTGPSLVLQCIKAWEGGEFAEQGCTLSLLLGWAWELVISTKASLDSACGVLYDWSGVHIDDRTDWNISHLSEILARLHQIFSLFTSQATPTTDRGQFEVELRENVVQILVQHCDVVRWCIWRGLLPEIDEASEPTNFLFAFPVSELEQAYSNRRAVLAQCKGTVSGLSLLLVDSLVESQGPHISQVWENMGGDACYPPPSMQAIAKMYLLEEVSLEVKHAVMLYFLHDLAALKRSLERETAIASFIQRFSLSANLVHTVKGLWCIDHSDTEEGVRQLVCASSCSDMSIEWYGLPVVNSLLAQGHATLASRFTHSKPALGRSLQEQRLYLSVLLHCKQVSQALQFVRRCDDDVAFSKLMNHLLAECQSHKLVGQLLLLSLDEREELAVEASLRDRPEPHALEPLLLYYLHRARFLQAFSLNQEINQRDKLESSMASQERSVTRNRLMQAYLRALPEVTRRMITEKSTLSAAVAGAKPRVQVDHAKPLSTVVRNAEREGMSQAKFLMVLIDKINEAKALQEEEEELETEEPVKNEGFESVPGPELPFLSTPRTPSNKRAQRKSEMFFAGVELSPVAPRNLSYSAKKTLCMIQTSENDEEKNSLRQLAAECVQVLQTPVRDHKLASPARTTLAHPAKTPQSILKVRRLSKTLPSPREKQSAGRRNSASRSSRVNRSKSDTSHNLSQNASLSSPVAASPSTPTGPATRLSQSASVAATPKQLRFIGISPSPTPSPSFSGGVSISYSVSVDSQKSAELATLSPEVVKDIPSPEVSNKGLDVSAASEPHAVNSDKDMEEEEAMEQEEASPVSVKETSSVAESLDTSKKVNLDTSDEDKYFEKLKQLARPDLESPWKSSSANKEEAEEVSAISEMTTIKERTEEITTISTTTVQVKSFHQELAEPNMDVSLILQEELPSTESFYKPSSPVVKSARKSQSPLSSVAQWSKLGVPKSKPAFNFQHLQVETSPKLDTKVDESPPATPPSSKRAKLMAKGDDTVGLVEKKPSPPLDREEPRRRKTPERKSPGRQTHDEDKEIPTSERVLRRGRRTPERKSPARKTHDEEEVLPSATPERQLSRGRKTPERKSPARKIHDDDEEVLPSATPERKLSRGRRTPERQEGVNLRDAASPGRSPSRKVQKLVDDVDGEGEGRKTPPRKSPSRSLRKAGAEETAENATEEPSEAEKSESIEDKPLEAEKSESIVDKPLEAEQSEVFKSAEEVLGDQEDNPDSPEVVVRRRSTRLNTPDRHSLDVARRSTRRESKTPERYGADETQRSARQSQTPERSVRKSSRQSRTPDRLVDVDLSEKVQHLRKSKRESKTPDILEMDESVLEMTGTPQRTRQQSKTPDRLIAEDVSGRVKESKSKSETGSLEVDQTIVQEAATPRKSTRLSKTPDRLISAGRKVEVSKSKANVKPTPSVLPEVDESVEHDAFTPRKSRRQSKTPDRLVAEGIAEKVQDLRSKSREESKLAASSLEGDEDTATKQVASLRRSTRQSITPDRKSLRQSTTPERRSTRQSRTPERRSVRKSVEPVTPTRRSTRKHKLPEFLETDEIEPVTVHTSLSPRRSVKETAAVSEPSTPPIMSASAVQVEEVPDRDVSLSHDLEEPIGDSPTRRSPRMARSPELLNTDDIQPVSPAFSPNRKAQPSPKTRGTEKEKVDASEKTKNQIADVQRVDSFNGASFVFTPPQRQSGTVIDMMSAHTAHQFVFSQPEMVKDSPRKLEETGEEKTKAASLDLEKEELETLTTRKEENAKTAKNKRKKYRPLFNDEEVSLLPESPEGTSRRVIVTRRQLSDSQKATAAILKKLKKSPKRRYLVPPSKRKGASTSK